MTEKLKNQTMNNTNQKESEEVNDNLSDNHNLNEEEENKDENSQIDDDPIYKNKLPNRIIVTIATTRNRTKRPQRLQFYVDRARRILRSDETITIIGLGQAISMACTLVEVLKRQKIGEIQTVRTTVDCDPSFDKGRLVWERPTTAIRFILKRGPHATYVSDYHQRKVIEIFENRDPDKTGRLSKLKVKELNMGEKFWSNEESIKESEVFLNKCDGDSINLPDFIRYASILIHPLLKDRKFKDQLVKEFGISEQDTKHEEENENEEDEDHDDQDGHEDHDEHDNE